MVIQFVVITKGATRISEVAARFALDGMPGRQMAIDADLNAGIIDEREAQRRRREITQQADFFGAMDGASKFVRGDAIAGIVITLINIVGGLFIGVVESGMSLGQAASLFTTLTIGDGLVTQVPAFLISLGGRLAGHPQQQRHRPAGRVPRAAVLAAAGLGRGRRDSSACWSSPACRGFRCCCIGAAAWPWPSRSSRQQAGEANAADAQEAGRSRPSRRSRAWKTTWPSIPWRSRSAWG